MFASPIILLSTTSFYSSIAHPSPMFSIILLPPSFASLISLQLPYFISLPILPHLSVPSPLHPVYELLPVNSSRADLHLIYDLTAMSTAADASMHSLPQLSRPSPSYAPFPQHYTLPSLLSCCLTLPILHQRICHVLRVSYLEHRTDLILLVCSKNK